MSSLPPWIRPAIVFGVPVVALAVALPYLTGSRRALPALPGLARPASEVRQAVGRALSATPASTTPSRVRFYECAANGTKVLSSTPCGPGARVREIDPAAVNHMRMDVEPAPADAAPVSGPGSVRSDLAAARATDAANRERAEADAQ